MTEDSENKFPNLIEKAQRNCQQLERQNQPITLTSVWAAVALAVFLTTFYIEVTNFTLGLRALFPPLSSGDKYGALVAALGIATGLVLVLGHILLKQASAALGNWFERLLVILGILSLAMLVIGAMIFLPASINQATGIVQANQANGAPSTNAAMSLGVILGALFPISILSNNIIIGWFTSALRTLEDVMAIRNQIKTRRALIGEIERAEGAIESLDAVQERHSASDDDAHALKWGVATEIATIAGKVAARHNEVLVIREAMGSAPSNAEADSELTSVELHLPLERLREMKAYLAAFTTSAVFKMLATKEA